MKRFLALLLSAAMLLGVCAFAEEAEVNHSYKLSGVVLTSGEVKFDFSNIDLCLDVVNDGPAALVHLDADGETAAELGFTKVDNLYVMHMAGALMGEKNFTIDPVLQLEKTLQGGIDGVVAMLQSIDTHAAAEKIVNFLENPMPAVDAEPEPEPTEEPEEELVEEEPDAEAVQSIEIDLSNIRVNGDIQAALKACVTSEKDVEVDGNDGIPAGKYDVDILYIDEEALAGMLDMVYMNDEPIGLGEKLRESGASVGLSAAKYAAEGVTAADIELGIDFQGESQSVRFIMVKTADESGSVTTFDFTCDNNGTPMSLQFAATESTDVDSAFGPETIDLANAVNLNELSDEESLAALSEAFQALQADAMIPVMGPIMEVMMANVDMDALQAEIDAAAADAAA